MNTDCIIAGAVNDSLCFCWGWPSSVTLRVPASPEGGSLLACVVYEEGRKEGVGGMGYGGTDCFVASLLAMTLWGGRRTCFYWFVLPQSCDSTSKIMFSSRRRRKMGFQRGWPLWRRSGRAQRPASPPASPSPLSPIAHLYICKRPGRRWRRRLWRWPAGGRAWSGSRRPRTRRGYG